MTTSKKKRKCLLTCARKGFTFLAVNQELQKECLDPIRSEEWNLWTNYYLGIVTDDPYFEHELISNNRSLAWFAKEINTRHHKNNVS